MLLLFFYRQSEQEKHLPALSTNQQHKFSQAQGWFLFFLNSCSRANPTTKPIINQIQKVM
jgi:hypothetical protein